MFVFRILGFTESYIPPNQYAAQQGSYVESRPCNKVAVWGSLLRFFSELSFVHSELVRLDLDP